MPFKTIQRPFRSLPSRTKYLFFFSHAMLLLMAVEEIPIFSTNSLVLISGFSCILRRIAFLRSPNFSHNFSPNFSPNFFCRLPPILFSSSTFDRTTLNHVSWFSNTTRTPPCLLQASSIRFMPDPYRSVRPTALKSDANCGLRGLVTYA